MAIFGVTSQAAEKIRWEDLRRRFTVCRSSIPCEPTISEHRIDVLTRDGIKHRNQNLMITVDRARLFGEGGEENLASGDVARIEVRRKRGRYVNRTVISAALPVLGAFLVCSDFDTKSKCNPFTFAVTFGILSPVWAYTAVTAPLHLFAEGVVLLEPAKTYEILP